MTTRKKEEAEKDDTVCRTSYNLDRTTKVWFCLEEQPISPFPSPLLLEECASKRN